MLKTLVAVAMTTLIAAGAAAQNFPSKPVHLVVPYPPGGATDVLARLVGDKLATRIGQQVVLENKPGAGGNIAANLIAKAPADGYTLLMANHPGLTTAPGLTKDPGFDPVKDFAAVGLLATQTMLLNLHPSIPSNTVSEFVAYVKTQPGKLNYATPGLGTPHHLAMEMFKQMAGIDLVHVPYKGGAPAMQDVVAGQAQVMFASYVIAGTHLQAGKLKAIAGSGRERTTQMPSVPTIGEQGYPGFDVTSWFGVVAPAGTPPAAISRLNQEMNTVLALPEVKEQLLKIGFDPAPAMTAAQFGAMIKNDTETWGRVIREAKITAE
jgi:tripartite-type tricarboxylate transporter receptor subunit TctC